MRKDILRSQDKFFNNWADATIRRISTNQTAGNKKKRFFVTLVFVINKSFYSVPQIAEWST